MALEDLTGSSKYINHLIATNPPGPDYLSEADDHLRGIKNVLKNTFANISGAVTATHTELNKLAGLQSFMATFLTAVTAAAARTALGVKSGAEITSEIGTAIGVYNGDVASLFCMPGTVADFAGVSAPTGWLLCYGQAISRTTYPNLFAAIGTLYGAGDGSTTFNLPDLRGRATFGHDTMGGTGANRLLLGWSGGINGTILGATGGENAHTLTTTEMPAHTHPDNTGSNLAAEVGATYAGVGGRVWGGHQNLNTGSTGGGVAHNIIPPAMVLNKIIKF